MRPNSTLRAAKLLSATMAALLVLPAMAGNAYETPPVLQARDLVPGGNLQGPGYRIEPEVPTEGMLMSFTVHSDFGSFTPRGPGRLENCLVEIAALQELEKVSESEVFAEGLQRSAEELGREMKNLVTEPADTLGGLADGVGRFFARTYRTTKTGVQRLGDVADDGNGEMPRNGPGAQLPGKATPQAEGTDSPDLVTASAAMAGNTAVNILGYDDQRREIAKQLKVDPYTTNKVLADKLDEVAWAAFAGGLGITALKMATPASTLVSMSAQASAWVWDTPPGDLKVYIGETLTGMGVSQEQVDLFLRQRWYTLTLRTRFAKALERIEGAEGQAGLMELALTVESEDQARFVIEALEMLATYHEKTAPIQAIDVRGTVIGRTKAGAIVLPAPVDYAAWTESLDRFTSREDLAAEQRSILLRGNLTPMAREKLERLGWQLRDGVSG